ncbi:HpcH/HpaI aldolase/citrate lyase family protein [Streptomyces sp. S465]|uniref:HpcH/HpaI aldolase/citrate lyase family protein n=1 Tax=Streptomyces sp. S465 TaxID=2979468 RepID=UPI0022A827EB|nr:CoA ester lyase [Streptomyces sp. S465]WAP54564.1 CoA ester lyase [Streptomyces sp. S465]
MTDPRPGTATEKGRGPTPTAAPHRAAGPGAPSTVGTARSVLFVPGSRPDRFAKATASGADLVVIDLEDAVGPGGKAEARATVFGWPDLAGVAVRINAAGTDWHEADLAAVLAAHAAGSGPAAVMLPKADAAATAATAAALPVGSALLPLVESARGVRDADRIAESDRVVRLVFGSVDYAHDIAATPHPPAEDELLYARSVLVNSSRAAGLAAPVDGVTLALDDVETAEREARRSRDVGFGGKLCLHPRQLPGVHRAFLPTEAEVAWARRAAEAAQRSDGGAIRLDGEIMDKPRLDLALRILAQADTAA